MAWRTTKAAARRGRALLLVDVDDHVGREVTGAQGAVVVHAVRAAVEVGDRFGPDDLARIPLVRDLPAREQRADAVEVRGVDALRVPEHQRRDRVIALPRPGTHAVNLFSGLMPRHDSDAGGPADLLAEKAAVRARVWEAMSVKGINRFPGPDNRIPNFVGAERAAQLLAETDEWHAAGTVKSNPDSPQLPVRVRALKDGKLVYMAVPRLAGADPFFVLDPARLADPPARAASIKNAARSARTITFDAMAAVDVVVTGCVAVGEDGARLGKGGGFSDLEFALAAAAGLIDDHTVVVTTVHDVQVQPAGTLPVVAHDMRVDLIATPTRVLRAPRPARHRLPDLDWDDLTEEKIAAIPVLGRLRAARS